MLPKQYRITPLEMRRVLQRGSYIRHNGLKILALPFASLDTPKIGFRIPLRIEKKATGRNRIRRCLQEAALHLRLFFLPSYGYVCIVDEKIRMPSTQLFEKSLKEALLLWEKQYR